MARFNFQGEKPPEELEAVCPLTLTQNVIAGRWKIIILWHLSQRTIRFNELQRLLPGISKGILTRQLRELEEDGIVHREVYKEVPPKVEYSLTDQGKRFITVLDAMKEWGKEFMKKKIEEHNYSTQIEK
ncbi:winged helix-turn-helix transcriptional regulator [Bacillus sp. NTK034]|uniref:winged helix-turn-helix transcriptional regulator n=1 Tax=Bacillus sp. NTK034 TaxID=2802176 RepID=UPI001A8E6F2A|nr:helix-turn-helix domain-containing protein [Bacillus sp. NTK034]MBN8203409.1 helix-turn-helix transcriptional regulator [Bacillus sp. NTK034]